MAVRRFGLTVLAAGLLAAGGACSSDAEPKGPTATVGTLPPTTTSTTTIEDLEAQVEAAYLESFSAYYEAVRSPGADHRLSQTHMGESLKLAEDFLARLQTNDQITEFSAVGPPRTTVVEVEMDVDANRAVVVACEVDDSVIVQLPSRTVVDGDEISSLVDATVIRSVGEWRLADIEVRKSWGDLEGCDR